MVRVVRGQGGINAWLSRAFQLLCTFITVKSSFMIPVQILKTCDPNERQIVWHLFQIRSHYSHCCRNLSFRQCSTIRFSMLQHSLSNDNNLRAHTFPSTYIQYWRIIIIVSDNVRIEENAATASGKRAYPQCHLREIRCDMFADRQRFFFANHFPFNHITSPMILSQSSAMTSLRYSQTYSSCCKLQNYKSHKLVISVEHGIVEVLSNYYQPLILIWLRKAMSLTRAFHVCRHWRSNRLWRT